MLMNDDGLLELPTPEQVRAMCEAAWDRGVAFGIERAAAVCDERAQARDDEILHWYELDVASVESRACAELIRALLPAARQGAT